MNIAFLLTAFGKLSNFTRQLIIITLSLLYGYFCRLLGIYFFGESKTIGWTLFWTVLIFLLRDRIKRKRANKQEALFEKIGIGFCVFFIAIKVAMFIALQQTEAYGKAIHFIKTHSSIQKETGTVKNISLVPYGAIAMTSNSQGSCVLDEITNQLTSP